MKIKKNFILRQVAGLYLILPIAEATIDFTGMITLNETGAMLWNLLKEGSTRESLAAALTDEYEVSYEQALSDVDEFIEKIKDCIDMQ